MPPDAATLPLPQSRLTPEVASRFGSFAGRPQVAPAQQAAAQDSVRNKLHQSGKMKELYKKWFNAEPARVSPNW